MPANWLQNLSWQDVGGYLEKDRCIILPVGATEEHGRFAPLGTDTLAAPAVAEDAGADTGMLLAQPLLYGRCPRHLVGRLKEVLALMS